MSDSCFYTDFKHEPHTHVMSCVFSRCEQKCVHTCRRVLQHLELRQSDPTRVVQCFASDDDDDGVETNTCCVDCWNKNSAKVQH